MNPTPPASQRAASQRAGSRDALDAYLARIGEAPLLTRADEAALAARIVQAERELFEGVLESGVPLPELMELADSVHQGHVDPSELVEPDRLDDQVFRRFETVRRLEERSGTMLQRLARASAGERAALIDKIDALAARRLRAAQALGLTRKHLADIGVRVLSTLEPLADTGVEARRTVVELEVQVGRTRKVLRPAFLRMQRASREIQRAKDQLTRSNLRLVVSWARRYVGFGLPLGDLVQEGNIGLMRAVDRFDHRVGTRFSTYASWWVRQALQRALQNTGGFIRVPVHAQASVRRAARARRDLTQRLGRAPEETELAAEMQSTIEKVRELAHATPATVSLQAPIAAESGERTLLDTIADMNAVKADEEVVTDERRIAARRLLSHLTPREQLVLRMRYGLGGRSYTLAEVGKQLGVTRERIRQIEAEALDKLRATATGAAPIRPARALKLERSRSVRQNGDGAR